jgi:hypothetical protein
VTGWRRLLAVPLAAALAAALAVALAGPAAAAPALRLQPHTLVVQVVPAMVGVSFTLDGRGFESGAGGVASITVDGVATRRLTIAVPPPRPGLRYEFQRWTGGYGGDEFSTSRTVRMGGRVTRLVAGFAQACLVRWSFVDTQGDPVPRGMVESVVLKDDSGGRYQKPGDGAHWLPASQPVRDNSGRVTARPLDYSVEAVLVDGANAVFRSQQRFRPAPNASWPISLRFYQMQISSHDAMFGFPAGSAVRLRSPDGQVQRLDLDGRSRASSGRLARGDYQLKVQGPGISWWMPVALSRDQEVELVFLSWLDLSVAALLAVLVLVGLPLLGGRLRRRRRAPATAATGVGAVAEDRDLLGRAGP